VANLKELAQLLICDVSTTFQILQITLLWGDTTCVRRKFFLAAVGTCTTFVKAMNKGNRCSRRRSRVWNILANRPTNFPRHGKASPRVLGGQTGTLRFASPVAPTSKKGLEFGEAVISDQRLLSKSCAWYWKATYEPPSTTFTLHLITLLSD
jgi:hypothetical protein